MTGSVFAFASKLRCHRVISAVAELGFAAVEDFIVDESLDATADAELDALLLELPEDGGCSSASHRIGGFVKAAWWKGRQSEDGRHRVCQQVYRGCCMLACCCCFCCSSPCARLKPLFPAARSDEAVYSMEGGTAWRAARQSRLTHPQHCSGVRVATKLQSDPVSWVDATNSSRHYSRRRLGANDSARRVYANGAAEKLADRSTVY